MITILLIAGMAMAGAMIISPQISYFRSRRDGEVLLAALRKARAQAMARGQTNGAYGVTIFKGRMDDTNRSAASIPYVDADQTPWCYVMFADSDSDKTNNDWNLGEVSMPTLLATLDNALSESDSGSAPVNGIGRHPIRQEIVNLHDETSLMGAPWTVGGGSTQLPIANGTCIRFKSNGKLETDGAKAELSTLITVTTGSSKSYSFDVKNPNMGYYRIRVRDNGTVEMSALCETGVDPYVLDKSGAQVQF